MFNSPQFRFGGPVSSASNTSGPSIVFSVPSRDCECIRRDRYCFCSENHEALITDSEKHIVVSEKSKLNENSNSVVSLKSGLRHSRGPHTDENIKLKVSVSHFLY